MAPFRVAGAAGEGSVASGERRKVLQRKYMSQGMLAQVTTHGGQIQEEEVKECEESPEEPPTTTAYKRKLDDENTFSRNHHGEGIVNISAG